MKKIFIGKESLVALSLKPNGPAIKGVFVAEGTEAVGRNYRIDFQFIRP